MERSESSNAAGCCFRERRRLVEAVSNCGYCCTSFEENERCRKEAVRESGERAKTCMMG